VIGVPVCWAEEFIGVLIVDSDVPQAFSPTDAEMLSLFSNQAAIAIRNARLYETERKRATQLSVVNQVARKAISTLDPNQLLQDVVTAIQQEFDYYNVFLLQLDQATNSLGSQAVAGGFADLAKPDYSQPVGEGLIGRAAETGQSLLVNNVYQDPRYIPGFEEASTKSELCVPLKLGDQVIGVLDIQETQSNAFDETDLMAMEALAGQIAMIIKNARLYEQAQQELIERKRAEEALQEYSEHLEEMVRERTQELRDTQEELVRKEKLATLGQLAGGLGHELRNPLGAIKNTSYFLNMVLQDPRLEDPDEEIKDALDILNKEVEASERIINSLLDFARQRVPTRREVDVNDILQTTLDRIPAPEHIEIESQLDKSLPPIRADADQLDQVFGNIILNSIQAMPQGGQLTIKTAETTDDLPKTGVSISFTDTGTGIPEEIQEKIFEPLFTTKAKGIGLGLSLVKSLVEGHQGFVEVESKEGNGSTFTIHLPINGK
jgi:signal transduction histidine kinase